MRYIDAPDLKMRMNDIVNTLGIDHIDLARVECLRSSGSSSRRTIARCHALGKLLQKAMKTKAFYAIEFLERFEKLSKEDQDKVIIHELMHIPKTFGGGFRQHDFVCEENVNILHKRYVSLKRNSEIVDRDFSKVKAQDFLDSTEKKGIFRWI
jgi:predicted metallopeptidase